MKAITWAVLFTLMLGSAALAETVRCRTRDDDGLKRWVTTCSDGARAITRWDAGLQRWYTDVVKAPKRDRAPKSWPVPGQPPR